MSDKTNWKYLFEKFKTNTCTKEELDEFLKLVQEDTDNEDLKKELSKYWERSENESKTSARDWKKFSSLINEAGQETPVVPLYSHQRRIGLMKWAAVASVLIILSFAAYLIFYTKGNSRFEISKSTEPQNGNEVAPGGNKAILTLSDGSNINLDSAIVGTIATQGNIRIIKIEDGELLYFVDHQSPSLAAYNTITIPRGGKYKIVLSDGSKVWLNAASSLKFPAAFTGNTRSVSLAGEGYFEVDRNEAKPFYVGVKNMLVRVLGTHFNINAYEDESSAKTTLLEGSVKVTNAASANNDGHAVLLKPGEQSVLAKDGTIKTNHHANMAEAVAWKDDLFEFNNAAIPVIMRQISRWYDVEIDYRGSIPTQKLTGKISRNVNLSQLIDMIQYTGVNMKIENKKIIIWVNKKK